MTESHLGRWLRRGITIPAYVTVALILLVLTPALVLVLGAIDIVRPRRFALVRTLLFLDAYLVCEVVGTIVAVEIWFHYRGWSASPSAAYLERNFALQRRWASALFASARVIFRLRVDVTGQDLLRPGPIVVLGRHVSPIDNLVPAVFVSAQRGLQLRWVINRWLRRDPCLDIVGHRLPNLFVDAARDERGGQAGLVRALAAGLGANDGVLIYPEGALISPDRRLKVIGRLAAGDPAAGARAEGLQNLLAPRTGGFLAVLEAAPDADVVLCCHTGLEPAGSYRSFLAGGLVGARVRIDFRRFVRGAIPAEAAGQADWLWGAWAGMDRWIGEQRAQLV
jgi:1-acyl-sn-glycerol-3-phosphate acyltransferase